MEWMNRGGRPGQAPSQPVGHSPAPVGGHAHTTHKTKDDKYMPRWMRVIIVTLLFSATILIVVLLAYMVVGGRNSNESKYVEEDKMQAVFLNGGQVYFGNIRNLNSKHLRLTDIYYLRVNQQVQPNQESTNNPNDISLVKLGCELHGPKDEMLINREQIVFWENLKTDGQVAKAVEEYVKNNPDGQKCDQTTSQPAQSDDNNNAAAQEETEEGN